MLVTLLQTDITWASPSENARRVERLLGSAPSSDLYVLPEMWSTGFATSPEGIAESDDASLFWMKQTAREHNAAISGSVAVALHDTEGALRYVNRHYFVKPDGSMEYYDKRHLFGYGGETLHYQAGNKRVVVEYSGWRILLQTCYDLRFPVWLRNRHDYDAILLVANWPVSRQSVWNCLLRARAIENQCYVIAVNRVGDDAACHYEGGSMIIDAKGHPVCECDFGKETTASATLDMSDLQAFREKFRVLDDADNYELIYQDKI